MNRSFLIGSLLLDVEVLDLVGGLVDGNDVQELTKAVSFEVFLGEVLQVSLGKGNIGLDGDFLVVAVDSHLLSKLAGFSVDFDSVFEELCEVGGVEDLVLDRLGTVDHEGSGDLSFCFLGSSLFGLGFSSDGSLFCGHEIYILYYYLILLLSPSFLVSFTVYFLPVPNML